ncbi:MAG: peptide deformylase [Tissierellia bacterium]|nr:peptide deformylase [Tissierellia bacterium]
MAIRNIRIDGDPILRKRSREVDRVDERILELINDMKETMYDADGVGLAAPQVGTLRRVVVVDVGEGMHVFINPEILQDEGEEIAVEGCLSIPGFNGTVARPLKLTLKFMDESGEDQTLEAEGFFARAICHEIDHLNGVLFKDIFIEEIRPEDLEEDSPEAEGEQL